MDYKSLGLKCGIEIHQQLEGTKLFCNCPAKIKDGQPDAVVQRQLRAVVGETGEVDKAALHEQERKKNFTYNYYDDFCCLVELDEEPPNPINNEAVKTALVVSKLLNSNPVDEMQVMRKTVVDGSNTTGFQRTALVAMDGLLSAEESNVRIESVCLEEDAAKIVERKGEGDVYNLSRLGIPLIEIATAPDMKTPEDVRIIAEKIGNVLRSTGKCKRGLGTIRQDVNISIMDAERVEIKGAQDLKTLTKIVEEEVKRQLSLISLKKELKFQQTPKIIDLTDVFFDSESKVIKKAIQTGGVVLAIKLKGFAGYVGKELQTGRRLGSEFSDYAKVKAGVGGVFHSDELPKYGITQNDVDSIQKKLKVAQKDAFVLVADKSEKATQAMQAVIERAGLIEKGVIKEVRKANPNGSTSYLRPMPGGARMYPETDVMPVKLDFNVELPELIEDKAKRYEKEQGLSSDLAKDIAKSEFNDFFERLCKDKKLKPGFIAETLVSFPAQLVRDYEGAVPDMVEESHLEEIFNALKKNEISKNSVFEAIVDISQGNGLNLDKYKTASTKDLEDYIKSLIKENEKAPPGAIVGMVMKKYNADGKKVKELVDKHMGE
ncbi:MAG: Glu-tRNA(Gln) amidotransferase subunit GatE [Candidatus Nanoarchaeia archaeon]